MSEPNTVDLDAVRAHIDILRHCKREEAKTKEQAEESRRAIEEALGDNETGTLDGQPVVRWTFVKTNRLNHKALKEAMPNVVALYTQASEHRRFDVLD